MTTSLAPEPDLGTPRGLVGEPTATVTIDGIRVMVAAGTSVLRAASLAGIDDPPLCATDSLEAFGSCRLCLVEVEGVRGTPASCTTPCSDGMVVATDTPQVQQLRHGCHGALPLRPPGRLRRLRARQLRDAGAGGTTSASPRCATASAALATSTRPDVSPTPTSRTTRRPASSARAACAPAVRFRAPSRSPSQGVASTRGSPPAARLP
jgi:hypothetical protein